MAGYFDRHAWFMTCLFEVKKPAEATSPWDLYKPVAAIPGDRAFSSAREVQVRAREALIGPMRSQQPRSDRK
jgi:hypothetical protein